MKFHYQDRVLITKGFFKGHQGILIDCNPDIENEKHCKYHVQLQGPNINTFLTVWIDEEYLEHNI